jgi:sterol 3beta-glucosyltransferase
VTPSRHLPAVVPKPPDWRNQQQVTGYWFLDMPDDYEPDRELDDFLAEGPLPVAIGFGSLVEHEGEAVKRLVIDALRETGQRGVLLGGWSELGAGPKPISRKELTAPRLASAIQ